MATILGHKRFKTPAFRYVRNTDKLPSTDAAHDADDPLLRVKLFNPTGIGTWWIAGFDPDTGIAWGVADIFEREVGDFDVKELAALSVPPFGLAIERDLWWKPTPLSKVLIGA